MKQASRQRFIAAASAAFASIGIIKAPARAATFEIKSATEIPADLPINVFMVDMWQAVEKESGGRIRVAHFPGSQLGNGVALLSQLRGGALDFTFPSSAVLGSVVPAAEIGTIGFAFSTAAQGVRSLSGGPLGTYLQNEITAKGMVPLGTVWDAGMLQVVANPRPVQAPADLSGMKLRVAPGKISVDLFKSFGGDPVPIALVDIYPSLQTKLIDAAAFGLAAIEKAKMYEVSKYLSLTNHEWACLWPLFSADSWSKLPPDLQGVIRRNSTKFALALSADIQANQQAAIAQLQQHGMTVNTVERAPFIALLHDYYKRWGSNFGATEWGLLETSIGRKLE